MERTLRPRNRRARPKARTRDRLCAGATALALLAASPAAATSVVHLRLGELADRAGLVFRGTVLSAESGAVVAGGGEIPTVTYRLRLEDAFKGDFSQSKGVVVLTMLGVLKEAPADHGITRLAGFAELPRLAPGSTYLLFTTPPSAIGLSAPVGLGQGAFDLYLSASRQEMVVNGIGNVGLDASIDGPVTYEELADAIRRRVGR